MIIICNTSQFRRKVVAYRNDYCTYCESTKLALRISSFWWLAIFFVPLIPLGRHSTWNCKDCGRSPHGKGKRTSAMVWAAIFAVMFGGTAVLYWTMPTDGPDGGDVWGVRIFLSLCCLAIGIWALRWKKAPRLALKLAYVTPALTSACALCGGALLQSDPCNCPRCGVDRLELSAGSKT
jgi:hypothetical protein